MEDMNKLMDEMDKACEQMAAKIAKVERLLKNACHACPLDNEKSETVIDRQSGKLVNIPIARFIAENLELTGKESDVVIMVVAYEVYLAYTKYPVGHHEFWTYFDGYFPVVTVKTKQTPAGSLAVLEGCRFRTPRQAE